MLVVAGHQPPCIWWHGKQRHVWHAVQAAHQHSSHASKLDTHRCKCGRVCAVHQTSVCIVHQSGRVSNEGASWPSCAACQRSHTARWLVHRSRSTVNESGMPSKPVQYHQRNVTDLIERLIWGGSPCYKCHHARPARHTIRSSTSSTSSPAGSIKIWAEIVVQQLLCSSEAGPAHPREGHAAAKNSNRLENDQHTFKLIEKVPQPMMINPK